MIINVNRPKNLELRDGSLFEPYLTYEFNEQQALFISDVVITYSGLVIKDEKLLKESHHNYPTQLSSYSKNASKYIEKINRQPTSLLTSDKNQTYLLIHHIWSINYYHWICEAIFRCWQVKKSHSNLILILPEKFKNIGFIKDSLSAFNFKDVFFIPAGKCLFVKNLCLPPMKPLVDSYDNIAVQEVRNFYRNIITKTNDKITDLGDRLYISRENATRKKISNEVDIKPILCKYNFQIVRCEDFSFYEQIAIFSNARYVVSMHGSGLTNMLFMKNNSSILELHKKITNSYDWHSKAFWYFADALKFEYYQQICDPTNPLDNYFNANYFVDPETLDANLALMLKGEVKDTLTSFRL